MPRLVHLIRVRVRVGVGVRVQARVRQQRLDLRSLPLERLFALEPVGVRDRGRVAGETKVAQTSASWRSEASLSARARLSFSTEPLSLSLAAAASLTATFSVFACPSGERATHSAAWRGLGLG